MKTFFAAIFLVLLATSNSFADTRKYTPKILLGEVDPTLENEYSSPPTFEDCRRLGWTRGMHVELGDLPDWMDQCLAGKIPFHLDGRPNRSSRR